jgi:putative ABC transport system permease protein
MALGASRSAVARLVLSALGMVLAGLMLGLSLALWTIRFAGALIEDLPVRNPAPIVFGGFTMVLIALVAAYIPARRAFLADPVGALRYE